MTVYERARVLITVLTYPHPSRSHEELVCTAGVTEAGEWVRLYPIDYRYLPEDRQYTKYQWIEVGLAPGGHNNDTRKESRRPNRDSIKLLGPRLTTKNRWADRRAIIDRLPVHTVIQLREMYDRDKTSLGVVRPTRILDLKIEPDDEKWKPEWEAFMKQLLLFGERKPLRKIPFSFRYVFECEDSSTPHTATLTDWEAGVLWLKEYARLGDGRAAAKQVRSKFLNEVCGQGKDTRFFMGTVMPYNTWLVLGVFWPPKGSWQPTLLG